MPRWCTVTIFRHEVQNGVIQDVDLSEIPGSSQSIPQTRNQHLEGEATARHGRGRWNKEASLVERWLWCIIMMFGSRGPVAF